MNRPKIRAGLIVAGALTAAFAGCQQTPKTTVSESKGTPKVEDPTAWSDKDVTRGASDSGAGDSGLARSSSLKGMLSSEGRDIEKSLGVGR
jgi:hypothetical protein